MVSFTACFTGLFGSDFPNQQPANHLLAGVFGHPFQAGVLLYGFGLHLGEKGLILLSCELVEVLAGLLVGFSFSALFLLLLVLGLSIALRCGFFDGLVVGAAFDRVLPNSAHSDVVAQVACFDGFLALLGVPLISVAVLVFGQGAR